MNFKFIKRDLLIYLKDKIGIFFSFLGMFISLIIYILFLRNNILNSFNHVHNMGKFLDIWMVAGLISIVAITSSLGAFSQKLEDKKNDLLFDFIVNGHMKFNDLNKMYTITAIIEGIVATSIFSLICFIYLLIRYDYNVLNKTFILVLLFNFLLVIFSSILFSLITDFLKTSTSFSSLSAIVGTLAGFFSGTYIIYGDLPAFLKKILNYWPGYQIAAISRYECLNSISSKIPNNIFNSLGVNSNFFKALFITIIFIIFIEIVHCLINLHRNYKYS